MIVIGLINEVIDGVSRARQMAFFKFPGYYNLWRCVIFAFYPIPIFEGLRNALIKLRIGKRLAQDYKYSFRTKQVMLEINYYILKISRL